jgi:hypothetical protein
MMPVREFPDISRVTRLVRDPTSGGIVPTIFLLSRVILVTTSITQVTPVQGVEHTSSSGWYCAVHPHPSFKLLFSVNAACIAHIALF